MKRASVWSRVGISLAAVSLLWGCAPGRVRHPAEAPSVVKQQWYGLLV